MQWELSLWLWLDRFPTSCVSSWNRADLPHMKSRSDSTWLLFGLMDWKLTHQQANQLGGACCFVAHSPATFYISFMFSSAFSVAFLARLLQFYKLQLFYFSAIFEWILCFSLGLIGFSKRNSHLCCWKWKMYNVPFLVQIQNQNF